MADISACVGEKDPASQPQWVPDQKALSEILNLLRESQSPDTAIQRSVQQVSPLNPLPIPSLFYLRLTNLEIEHTYITDRIAI